MEVISLYPENIDSRAINRATEILESGNLIIYPTDTHPALAADSLNTSAIQSLCRLKGVDPSKHTLTLVCSSIGQASQYARIDNRAYDIIRRNTPGPFTFILPPSAMLPKQFKGRKQVGIRIPDNSIALSLAEELEHPLLSGSLGDMDPSEFDSQVELIITNAMQDDYSESQSSAIINLMDSTSPEIVREGSKELN